MPSARREKAGAEVMARDRLGVSIVGAGYWGPNLLRNFFGSACWEVVSVVDRDQDRLDKVLRAFPTVQGLRDFSTILDDDRVDAVAIATPVETHFAIARAALLAGKHVMVEKPMTETSEQGIELSELAAERGLTVMVDHTFLYTGAVETLKQLVGDQEFGRILYIDSVRVNLGLFQSRANVVYDLAPHDVSIINYILDEYPISVSAHVANCIHHDMADVAFLTMRYPSGVLAHAHLSWLSPVKMRRLTIAGRSKMAVWDDVEPSEKIRVYDKGVEVNPNFETSAQRMVSYRTGDMHAPAIDGREALSKAVVAFYRSIVDHAPLRSSAVDGLAVVRVLEAAEHSIQSGGTTVDLLEGVLV